MSIQYGENWQHALKILFRRTLRYCSIHTILPKVLSHGIRVKILFIYQPYLFFTMQLILLNAVIFPRAI